MRFPRLPLEPARLSFGTGGVPYSDRYGDVYHSRAGALAQARHTFLEGNGLPQRWAGRDAFTVCETGFGLGNNFLALWSAWRSCPHRPRRLHVLSFEAHPFSRKDLAIGLADHAGEMGEMARALITAWPPLLPGLHRLEFENGALTLTLAFGRIEYLARQVEAGVDAFFLDGFSPQLNPAMWSRELFGQLVRLANRDATAATWCSAGQVRRDLAAAGFLVERARGFGGKREMSKAVLRPGLGRAVRKCQHNDVIVVGGGLAGAGLAHSLALRGHAVTVLDPEFEKGAGGSHEGHHSAAMTPALSRDDNPMSRLSRAGILLAQLRWQALVGIHETCGSLVRVPAGEQSQWDSAVRAWGFPTDWADWCNPGHTEERTGFSLSSGGVWLGAGKIVRPAHLVRALLAHHCITVRARGLSTLRHFDGRWHALGHDGAVLASAPLAVIAAGPETPALLASAAPGMSFAKLERIQRMGGQVAYFRAGRLPDTRAIVAGSGYWLPALDGIHVGGSTYTAGDGHNVPTQTGFASIVAKLAGLLELDAERLESARASREGWSGWRAAVSDHLPVIGAVDAEESLWVACAYGSRGLSWMTLAGEIMAAKLGGEPLPLERDLLRALRPR